MTNDDQRPIIEPRISDEEDALIDAGAHVAGVEHDGDLEIEGPNSL